MKEELKEIISAWRKTLTLALERSNLKEDKKAELVDLIIKDSKLLLKGAIWGDSHGYGLLKDHYEELSISAESIIETNKFLSNIIDKQISNCEKFVESLHKFGDGGWYYEALQKDLIVLNKVRSRLVLFTSNGFIQDLFDTSKIIKDELEKIEFPEVTRGADKRREKRVARRIVKNYYWVKEELPPKVKDNNNWFNSFVDEAFKMYSDNRDAKVSYHVVIKAIEEFQEDLNNNFKMSEEKREDLDYLFSRLHREMRDFKETEKMIDELEEVERKFYKINNQKK